MTQYLEKLNTLPGHMRDSVRLWIERAIPPGSFLEAVLCNDLFGAMGRADDVNVHALKNYAVYFYSFAPSGCYGSTERFSEWAKSGGLIGQGHELEGVA